jgi:hypothetical protein
MITDTEIMAKGMTLLASGLGIVDAERFIALIQREPFDYTRWRQTMWNDLSVDNLLKQAEDACGKKK